MMIDTTTNNDTLSNSLNEEFKDLTSEQKDTFPVHVFHEKIQNIINELQAKVNYPKDFTSASILSASSTAIGNKFLLVVKDGLWHEKCNLFMILIGEAGSNKSHPMDFAYKPISKIDKKHYEIYKEELKIYKRDIKEGLEVEKPIFKKTIMSDFTPEALGQAHFNNPKGLAIVVDELKAWLKNFNRYNNGGDEQLYLTLWSGKTWVIDRKKDDYSLIINDPFINVIGTIQPKIIKDFAQGDKSDNGFLDRMLFVYPKKEYLNLWSDSVINPEIIKNYSNLIYNLNDLSFYYNSSNEEEQSIYISFDNEAKHHLYKWQNEEEMKLKKRDYNYEKSIFAKIQIYVLRFCLILHLQDQVCNMTKSEIINIDIVKRAIVLGEYFRKESLEIRESINHPSPLLGLTQKQKDVLFALPTSFSKRDGEQIALKHEMPSATFSRFLKKKRLFKKVDHGSYLNLSK